MMLCPALSLSFSVLFSSEAVTQWTTEACSLFLSLFCTLPVKCYLVHCGLLAWFCCAAEQSGLGLDRGNWWMVFPEPYKESSSLLHWCVDVTQLAAQWVCTVYCCGLTSRQMHMDAQSWKELLCFLYSVHPSHTHDFSCGHAALVLPLSVSLSLLQ